MKTLFRLLGTAAALGWMHAGTVMAQAFTNLHSFTPAPYPYTNGDGANPRAGLLLSGGVLYGVAANGGSAGNGVVFKVSTNGSGFTNLHSLTNSTEGRLPYGSLIISGNTLYGTAHNGGNLGYGTVFAMNTDGGGFTNLHNFNGPAGYEPGGGLVLSGATLYGTVAAGGSSNRGAVFSLSTNGTGFTILHNFGGPDGAAPQAGLILSGSTLYGTTQSGGSSNAGAVFALNTDSSGFTNLHHFPATSASFPHTNTDGANPYAGLVQSGSMLYGTTLNGGDSGAGTVFAVATNGSVFRTLHSFGATATDSGAANPYGGLIASGNILYGTTSFGGTSNRGAIFSLNTDGSGFRNVYNFGGNDGANPRASLVLTANTLYGTTEFGGSLGNGALFSLFIRPQLTITSSGANVLVTWPADASGFTLQSATNLMSPVTWTAVSPGPTVVNGLNTITNSASDPQKFYRLSQ